MSLLRKSFIVLVFLTFSVTIVAQGLNYERGFNDDFYSTPLQVVSDGSDAFVTFRERNYWDDVIRLKKIDSLGTELWNINIAAYAETPIDNVIPDGQGGVYIAGGQNNICDVVGPNQGYLARIDADGNILWSHLFGDDWPNPEFISGLTVTDNGLIKVNHMSYEWASTGEVRIYFDDGQFLAAPALNNAFVDGFLQIGGYSNVIYKSSKIIAYAGLGIAKSIDFQSNIINAIDYADVSVYVTLSDRIVLLNSDLEIIYENTFEGYGNFSQLKVNEDNVQFLSSSDDQTHIITVDLELNIMDVDSYDIEGVDYPNIDFSDTHITVSENYQLSTYNAVRLRSYKREDSTDNPVTNTDIGVSNVEITSLETSGNDVNLLNAKITVQNYGENVLNEFRLFHLSFFDICGEVYYNGQFEDLSVAPGDSVEVEVEINSWGWGGITFEFDEDGNYLVDLCIYTGDPNSLVDPYVDNDAYCQFVEFSPDCPDLGLNIGDECDDGDPETEDDLITNDCICAGIPINSCPTDFNSDGTTESEDFSIFLGNFGFECSSPPCPADLNGSGTTDGDDFTIFLGNYGLICD